MLSGLLPFSLVLALASGCPCTFNEELGEVNCDPDTQSLLPWFLPECLSHVDNDQVTSRWILLHDSDLTTSNVRLSICLSVCGQYKVYSILVNQTLKNYSPV